jgi:hypothetical protein
VVRRALWTACVLCRGAVDNVVDRHALSLRYDDVLLEDSGSVPGCGRDPNPGPRRARRMAKAPPFAAARVGFEVPGGPRFGPRCASKVSRSLEVGTPMGLARPG